MKTLILLFSFAALIAVHVDDNFLQNGDFSDGLAHWYGNLQAVADVPEAGSTAENAGVIKLHRSDWARVTQDFEVKGGTYKLHLTFAPSADTHFSMQLTDYIGIAGKVGFSDEHPADGNPGQWIVAVSDSTTAPARWWSVDVTKSPGAQSYTFTVKDINFDHRQTLILAFPPGSGYIVLTNVSLVREDAP
jgi:hypothetical protein